MKRVHLIIALCVLSACVPPRVANRGHMDMVRKVEEIKAGDSHKQDVIRLLGSPSTQSTFGDETWYYVAARREAVAFFEPEVTEQQVTQVTFNGSGLVTDVQRYNLEDSQEVDMVEKVTPTEGHSLGFMEQVLGNLGRFNKPRSRTLDTGR